MADSSIDYSKIILQENIALTADEIANWESLQKQSGKTIPLILGGSTIFTMALIAWFIKDDFTGFRYYDYILFGAAGLALFFLCYFFVWVINLYDNNNWKKDKLQGKNKLTSIIIDRDKTEYGEYLSFAGPHNNQKIRIKVKQQDYSRYQPGAKIIVTYLKFSKEALELELCDQYSSTKTLQQ